MLDPVINSSFRIAPTWAFGLQADDFTGPPTRWDFEQGIRSRIRSLVMTTGFGAFGVIAAGFNGGSFLNYNEDFSSMLMAAFFAAAVIAYTAGLFIMAGPERA